MGSVLVIDDEIGISEIIREVLSVHGYSVETACNGREGIDKYDSADFDVVITDVCMPGIDGREVLAYIRGKHDRQTPIIGMSGTPWLLEQIDFDMVLSKPFSLKSLVESVQSLHTTEH